MNKKVFLENNKKELAKMIAEINKNNDDALSDYLMERAYEIVNKAKNDIDLITIKERLISEVKNFEIEDNYYEEELEYDDNEEMPIYVDDDSRSLDALQQYRREVEKFPLLTPEQEKELFRKYKNGDEYAKELIINSNLRLVMKIAGRYKGSGIQILDLIQEGNIGLQIAVERFDLNRGTKLSTYASHWIRQSIQRIIPEMSLQYRIPVHVEESKWKIIKAEREIAYTKGREATFEELADLTGIDIEHIRIIKTATTQAASLHKPVGDEADTELGDMIADEQPSVEETSIQSHLQEDIMKAMDNDLTEKEKKVIIDRFGFETGTCRTLEMIGDDFHVTRERIRQIEAKALRKLYRKERHTGLRDYLD